MECLHFQRLDLFFSWLSIFGYVISIHRPLVCNIKLFCTEFIFLKFEYLLLCSDFKHIFSFIIKYSTVSSVCFYHTIIHHIKKKRHARLFWFPSFPWILVFIFIYCQLFDYVRYEVRCWWLILHLIYKEGLGLLQLEMETVFRAVVLFIMQKKGLSPKEICIHDSRKLVSQSCRTKGGFSKVYYTVWSSIMWFLNCISLVS